MEAVKPDEIAERMHDLEAPRGHEESCGSLAVLGEPDTEYGAVYFSFWELTAEEIGELARGGRIRLQVCGPHPPVSLAIATAADARSLLGAHQ